MNKKDKLKKLPKRKKKRLKKSAIVLLIIVLGLMFFKCYKTDIKNIYISGNNYYKDQQIIDLAHISNYPNSFSKMSIVIKNDLEKDKYILKAKVYKKDFLSKVYIDIVENYPLFYYQITDKTILYNGDGVEKKETIVTVINQIPDTIYDEFLERIRKIDVKILNRMSEIKYSPNAVDNERFFITMNDGNYIYITLNKFSTVNKYLDIIEKFDNKKGILYLDSGEYFDLFDN